MPLIAHLRQNDKDQSWIIQSLENHSNGVAELTSRFAGKFGCADLGRTLGLLHDIGKQSNNFQKYIRHISGYQPGVWNGEDKNHSIIGALFLQRYPLFANIIGGHHRGLYDFFQLDKELEKTIPPEINIDFPKLTTPKLKSLQPKDVHHLIRMLFSCLVDADYLDTERFMQPKSFESRGQTDTIPTLAEKIDSYAQKLTELPKTPLNDLRSKIQKYCLDNADLTPGLFELSVPTGGGKTLASILWAIHHALSHNKERIIIAIPYTSIIVQTAQILRNIFGPDNIVEHHSVVDEDNLSGATKLASENWDAPIIVTTNVQLFESMFANRPSKCRKLHSLVNSVIILDEVQALPFEFLQPIVDALETYTRIFGTSVLFCTASQPILDGERKGSGQAIFKGIPSENIRKLVPDSIQLHDKLRRVRISMPHKLVPAEEICRRIAKENRVLCVVNTRNLARTIYEPLKDDPCSYHLSRMMCPAHIRQTIASIRDALASNNKPVRVVSTQLIEAGVDIDFPVVFRQLSGLDSILQAAGRCNREGRLDFGATFVFEIDNYIPRGTLGNAVSATKTLLNVNPKADWQAPSTMRNYYEQLYARTDSFDKADINKKTADCFPKISFESAAESFKLIEEKGFPVIVNYGEADELIKILREHGPSRDLLRRVGQYTVTVPKYILDSFLKAGLIEEPHIGIFYIPFKDQYDSRVGLKIENSLLDNFLTI